MDHSEALESGFKVHHPSFAKIIGSAPTLKKLLSEDTYPFAHEAGVFFPDTNELFITSNRIYAEDGSQSVQISKISLTSNDQPPHHEEVTCEAIHMGNGGINYQDGILFCAQGSPTAPSGLYFMKRKFPYDTTPIITSFYGTPFNSVNDVVVGKDGSIWFTDPAYGFEQGYRPFPSLPSQLYRYDPKFSSIRAMADHFGHPNGLCFSPDEKTLYVTDTDKIHGSGSIRPNAFSSIYAFDVENRHGQPLLFNRRLFAYVEAGFPDGIKCDVEGNVYSGCGDGVEVWSPAGVLLGRILVKGGATNFCFGREGEMFLLNQNHLWKAQLSRSTKGALLGI